MTPECHDLMIIKSNIHILAPNNHIHIMIVGMVDAIINVLLYPNVEHTTCHEDNKMKFFMPLNLVSINN